MSAPPDPNRQEFDFMSLIGFALIGLVLFTFLRNTSTPPPRPSSETAITQEERSETGTQQTEKQAQKEITQGINKAAPSEPSEPGEFLGELFSVNTPEISGTLTSDGRIWSELSLKKYHQTPKGKEPIYMIVPGEQDLKVSYNVGAHTLLPQDRLEVVDRGESRFRFKTDRGGIIIERMVELDPSGYHTLVTDRLINPTGSSLPIEMTHRFHSSGGHFAAESNQTPAWTKTIQGFVGGAPQDHFQFVSFVNGSLKSHVLMPGKPLPESTHTQPIDWAGVADNYFFLGTISIKGAIDQVVSGSRGADFSQSVSFFKQTVEAKSDLTLQYRIYHGPKKIDYLSTAGSSVERVINFGDWFGGIARFLLRILLGIHSVIPNYGIAIILLTFLVKLILFPLNQSQYRSMQKMQKIQPLLAELRTKYKEDKQKQNLEMMRIFKENKVNPMGGCFPILIQIPIFFALYQVFLHSIELRHSPFFGWIEDLSTPDPFLITPIAMGAMMYLQQKVTPMPTGSMDPEVAKIQAKMFQLMPIIMTLFMLFLPAGLCLYILVNAGLSIAQQRLLIGRPAPSPLVASS